MEVGSVPGQENIEDRKTAFMSLKHLKHLMRGILRFTLALATALGLPASLRAADGPQELTVDHPKVKEVIVVQEQVTKDLMAQPEIDGALVGGASLDPISFASIVNF